MELIPNFIPLLTIAMGIGLPALLLIQLLNKKSVLLKIPSLKIWKILLQTVGWPPKKKLNLLNANLLMQIILLCLLAYLCSGPVLLQQHSERPVFNLIINRSTSMAAKSENDISRWEHLKKNLYNELMEKGLKPEDHLNLQLNPPLQNEFKEISLSQIDNEIEKIKLVDLPPMDSIFYQTTKMKGETIYVTDSVTEIPESLMSKILVILINNNESINVGWVEFWLEDQTINGVLKNYSNFTLNVNIDLKVNGNSIQADDLEPAIKPNDCYLFQKNISKDFQNINLIELLVTCPGDALEADNYIAISRLNSQNMEILVDPNVPASLIKAIRSLGEKVHITHGVLSPNSTISKFDLVIHTHFDKSQKVHQLIINPTESNSFFQILNAEVNGISKTGNWLNSNEKLIFENVMFEKVKEVKEDTPGNKFVMEENKLWPIVERWKNENYFLYLLNFDCSEKTTLVQTPCFPFLIAKIIDELNLNRFHYFKTGETVDIFSLSSANTKVFQSNLKGSNGRIDFSNSDSLLLTNAGIFANENLNICVNLLNEKESNISHDKFSSKMQLHFKIENEKVAVDLKPYIAGLILLLFIVEWVMFKKEN